MAVFIQRRGRTSPALRSRCRPGLEALEERALLSPYSDAVLADGPAGYWRLGESEGTPTALDSSPFNRHGTYAGHVYLGQPGAIVSDPDTGGRFDRLVSNVRVPGGPFDFANNFTLEAWVVNSGQESPNFLGRIISNGQPGALGYGFGVLPSNNVRFTTYGIRDYNSAVAVPQDGRYHHVVVTLDASNTARFYVDGTLGDTLPGPAPANSSPFDFHIGVNPMVLPSSSKASYEFWNGLIDEAAVYSQVLNAAQIANHWQIGVGGRGGDRAPGQALPQAPLPAFALSALAMTDLIFAPAGEAGHGLHRVTAEGPSGEQLDRAMVADEQVFASLPLAAPAFLPSPTEHTGHGPESPWRPDGFAAAEIPWVV